MKHVGDVEALVRQLIEGHSQVVNGEIEIAMGNYYDSIRGMYLRGEAIAQLFIKKGLLTEDEIVDEGELLQARQTQCVQITATTSTIEDRISAMDRWNEDNPTEQITPHDVELYPMIMATTKLSLDEKYSMLEKAGVSDRIVSKLRQHQDTQKGPA